MSLLIRTILNAMPTNTWRTAREIGLHQSMLRNMLARGWIMRSWKPKAGVWCYEYQRLISDDEARLMVAEFEALLALRQKPKAEVIHRHRTATKTDLQKLQALNKQMGLKALCGVDE